jgi:hypothetical protein
MRARIPLVLACAALVAVACQDTPTEPVEQPVATAPTANFINGPESPGVVYRYRGDLIWIDVIETTPQEEPWVVFFGTQFGEQLWLCGGPRYYETTVQQVGGEKELLVDKEYPLVAYRAAEFFPLYDEGLSLGEVPFCYAGSRAEQIAGGTGHVVAHGTPDLSFFSPVVNGTVTWQGEVYRIHYKAKQSPDGSAAKGRIW